jgi:hypothetical protein
MDGGTGGGAGTPEQRFCGGAAPELAKSAALGLGSPCYLDVGGVRDVRSPPGGLFGFGEARSCARVGGGGSAGCGRRRARVQAARVHYGYGNWRKGAGGLGHSSPSSEQDGEATQIRRR